MTKRLATLPQLQPMEKAPLDTVAASRKRGGGRAMDILLQAQSYWDDLEEFRLDRERNKLYYFGKPWKDKVYVDGRWKAEEDYIKEQGKVPLQQNLIRRLGRNVVGVYRDQSKEPTCTAIAREEQQYAETMSTLLKYNWKINKMDETNARSFERYLISGMVVHRKTYRWKKDKCDIWTEIVDPNRFFFSTDVEECDGGDASMVGMVHDMPFEVCCREFAKSPQDVQALSQIYYYARNKEFMLQTYQRFGKRHLDNIDFMLPQDLSKCRIIEVWNKELKPRYHCHDLLRGECYKIDAEDKAELVDAVNEERRLQYNQQGVFDEAEMALIKAEWFMDDYWYYRYITPTGYVLQEGETPYEHGGHPFVFKMYPFIDGEIHSFVSDLIDQQRYVNRLITMYDWIMSASAKGVLLFPSDALPDGYSMEEIADEWARYNGVIVFKAKQGVPIPQQISNNATNIGITELINLQLKFFEDISGVQGALQGRPGYSSTSGTLYAQQTINSTKSLLDILESFSDFVRECAMMDVKLIQQYYDEAKVKRIVGKDAVDFLHLMNADLDMNIVESTSSPAFRDRANEFLFQLWSAQAISLEQMLEQGDFPFADALLQSIKSDQNRVQQGQRPQGVSPEVATQVQDSANTDAVDQLYNNLYAA